MKRLIPLAAAAAMCITGGGAQAANVALGADVSVSGAGFGNSGWWGGGNSAGASTITDGVYVAASQEWNNGTVFWSGAVPDPSDLITISLPGAARVTSITLQADNNDDYRILFKDTNSVWHDLAVLQPLRSWGMQLGSVTFTEVIATAFQIQAVGGDGLYSVSEFEAIGERLIGGNPVPEPASLGLAALGLGLLLRRPARSIKPRG